VLGLLQLLAQRGQAGTCLCRQGLQCQGFVGRGLAQAHARLGDVRQGLLLLHEGVRSLNLRRPARPRDGGGGNLAGEGLPRGGLLVAAPFGARCEGLERVLAGTR